MIEFLTHNPFLVPVGLCGLVGLSVAAERTFHLYVRAALAPAPFFAQIQKSVLEGQLDGALAFCASAPRSPLANVVKAALWHADASREDLMLALDQAIAEEAPGLQKRLGYLSSVANIVTLFGLLGTIFGLITSFDAVSAADPEQKQTLLAQGIALAMYTTASGIAVAIPALAIHAVLSQRVNTILDDLDRYGLRTIQLLLARRGEKEKGAAAQ